MREEGYCDIVTIVLFMFRGDGKRRGAGTCLGGSGDNVTKRAGSVLCPGTPAPPEASHGLSQHGGGTGKEKGCAVSTWCVVLVGFSCSGPVLTPCGTPEAQHLASHDPQG